MTVDFCGGRLVKNDIEGKERRGKEMSEFKKMSQGEMMVWAAAYVAAINRNGANYIAEHDAYEVVVKMRSRPEMFPVETGYKGKKLPPHPRQAALIQMIGDDQ